MVEVGKRTLDEIEEARSGCKAHVVRMTLDCEHAWGDARVHEHVDEALQSELVFALDSEHDDSLEAPDSSCANLPTRTQES